MSPGIAAPRAVSSNGDSFAECSALPQSVLGPSISTPEVLGFPHFMTTERDHYKADASLEKLFSIINLVRNWRAFPFDRTNRLS
jgi:hypothetical protein